MSEFELQHAVYQMLQDQTFARNIKNINYFKGRRKGSRPGVREYSIKNIMTDRYDDAVLWVYERLLSRDVYQVGGPNPRNIALGKKDRLFPDIIIYDDERNFIIFELKVGKKTEREAVTELFAYVFELRTVMPSLNNSEISLVVVSEEFGTLLSHAVLQLISYFGLRVMCLKPIFQRELTFNVEDPLKRLGLDDFALSEDSFTTFSLCLNQTERVSPSANVSFDRVSKIAEDMLLDRANRLSSNGFYFINKYYDSGDEVGAISTYFITIALVDPFKLLDIEKLTASSSELSDIVLEMAREGESHLQNHYWELVKEAQTFLGRFYSVSYEGCMSYSQYLRSVNRHMNVNTIACNVWGEFGEFVREVIYSDKSGFDILNEEIDHANPLCLWEALGKMFGNEQ